MAVIGSPPGAFPQLTITSSMTWVPPQDGNVTIHVVGAGGSGYGGSSPAFGGGAGAYAKIPSLAVTTSGSFTLVIGVGGTSVRNATNGVAGGNSTIAGTGLTGTKTCGGGGGGASGNAAGGTVSGSGEGWAGYSGGAGRMGGGAVGVYATGALGGAALEAGDASGGMSDAAAGGLAMSQFGVICGGNTRSMNNNYGAYNQSLPTGRMQIQAGDLCGGGITYITQLGRWTRGGNGGIGGGGGGAVSATGNSGAAYAISGMGGDGIILIQYIPW